MELPDSALPFVFGYLACLFVRWLSVRRQRTALDAMLRKEPTTPPCRTLFDTPCGLQPCGLPEHAEDQPHRSGLGYLQEGGFRPISPKESLDRPF
jgi:hypothetical protein